MLRGEQLGLEGMPHRLYPCTPTRLTTWLSWPRLYRMTFDCCSVCAAKETAFRREPIMAAMYSCVSLN